MTEASFISWYPQFESFAPAFVLRETVSRASGLFAGMEPEDAEEARRLYTAHRLTLYALAQPESGTGPQAAAAAGTTALQRVASRKVGEVSVTYAENASAGQAGSFTDLAETVWGIQLLGLMRLYSGTRYIP